jgi:hypothetical protein
VRLGAHEAELEAAIGAAVARRPRGRAAVARFLDAVTDVARHAQGGPE